MDDRDLDAAKPLRTLIWKVVRTQFTAKDPAQMQKFHVSCAKPGLVPPRVVVFVSLRAITAKILVDAVKLGFGPIRVCTTGGQPVIPLDPEPAARTTVRSWCARAHWKFAVSVTLHTFRSPLSLHGSQGLLHTLCEWAREEIRHLLHTQLNGLSL